MRQGENGSLVGNFLNRDRRNWQDNMPSMSLLRQSCLRVRTTSHTLWQKAHNIPSAATLIAPSPRVVHEHLLPLVACVPVAPRTFITQGSGKVGWRLTPCRQLPLFSRSARMGKVKNLPFRLVRHSSIPPGFRRVPYALPGRRGSVPCKSSPCSNRCVPAMPPTPAGHPDWPANRVC